MIEEIEEVRREAHLEVFGEVEVLEDGEIQIPASRPDDEVPCGWVIKTGSDAGGLRSSIRQINNRQTS